MNTPVLFPSKNIWCSFCSLNHSTIPSNVYNLLSVRWSIKLDKTLRAKEEEEEDGGSGGDDNDDDDEEEEEEEEENVKNYTWVIV